MIMRRRGTDLAFVALRLRLTAVRCKACPLARCSVCFEGLYTVGRRGFVYRCLMRLNAYSIIEEVATAWFEYRSVTSGCYFIGCSHLVIQLWQISWRFWGIFTRNDNWVFVDVSSRSFCETKTPIKILCYFFIFFFLYPLAQVRSSLQLIDKLLWEPSH